MVKGKKTFEESMIELEKIVENLERGEMPLENSIEAFQKGMELSKNLSKTLLKVAVYKEKSMICFLSIICLTF